MNALTIAAEVEQLETVTAFVNEQLEMLGCSVKTRMQIDIAVEEIFSNIAFYAYTSKTGNVLIELEILENPTAVKMMFIDSGRSYDPLKKEDPDITLSAEERQIGGLGIFMAKKIMDEMTYEFKDGQNRLSITKYLV